MPTASVGTDTEAEAYALAQPQGTSAASERVEKVTVDD